MIIRGAGIALVAGAMVLGIGCAQPSTEPTSNRDAPGPAESRRDVPGSAEPRRDAPGVAASVSAAPAPATAPPASATENASSSAAAKAVGGPPCTEYLGVPRLKRYGFPPFRKITRNGQTYLGYRPKAFYQKDRFRNPDGEWTRTPQCFQPGDFMIGMGDKLWGEVPTDLSNPQKYLVIDTAGRRRHVIVHRQNLPTP